MYNPGILGALLIGFARAYHVGLTMSAQLRVFVVS